MTRLLAALGADEGLTRYVGGAVRDDLLGLPVSDVDLATRIQPDEVIRRLEKARIKAVPTGIEHGTITAVSDGQPFEITTLRRDVSTDGRRATVAFTDDWREDAARRDFTINALSADPLTGEMFDYFGGLDRPRAAAHPVHRRPAAAHCRGPSAHPALLPLPRPLRRRAQPDAAALDACTARANDLMALSRERIADELLKLLGLADPSRDGADHARARNPEAGASRDRAGAARRARSLIAAGAGGRDRGRTACGVSRLCCRAIRRSRKTSLRG